MPPASISFTSPTEYSQESDAIARQRKYAELMRQAADEPLDGSMVSGIYVAPSATQHLARALKGFNASYAERDAAAREKANTEKYRAGLADALHKMGAGDSSAAMGYPELAPIVADDMKQQARARRIQALLGGGPVQPMTTGAQQPLAATGDMAMAFMLGGDPETARFFQSQQNYLTTMKDRQDARQEADRRYRDLAEIAHQDRVAGMNQARMLAEAARAQKNVPKLPASALKMQQEELDAIGAAAINADLAKIVSQIKSGEINLGPVNNAFNRARNAMGLGTTESKNLATLEATLERMRNESLRLNKGIQTEGDSERAWNELVKSINDPGVVEQRLQEIIRTNERAILLRKNNIDLIRANYGLPPLDTSDRENLPAAVGANSRAPAGAQQTQSRPPVTVDY